VSSVSSSNLYWYVLVLRDDCSVVLLDIPYMFDVAAFTTRL
jgi:hypothetical protein